MVEIFITDSPEKYKRSDHPDRILYLDGFIGDCSFITRDRIDEFNSTLVGLENDAAGLMLQKLDEDAKTIVVQNLRFGSNRFIAGLPVREQIYSTLLNFHRHFVLRKYLFQLVFDRFLASFTAAPVPMILSLSESYYLTQSLPYDIRSTTYYPEYHKSYAEDIARRAYYFFHSLLSRKNQIPKTHIAVFLLDIPNEFDLIRKFVELVKSDSKLTMTIVLIDSGNPADKKVDPSLYRCENVNITYLHEHKANLNTDYSDFYKVCERVDPLYSIFRRARLCESQDIQYAFMDNVISSMNPDACLYLNTQEHGRIMANVCATYNIPSICVDYSFFFDTYNIEKRIKFDVRACISDGSVQNWIKHHDLTPRHEITGFCKIDDWHEKLIEKERSKEKRIFDNNKRTILFASTWAPNPNSPLLTEKVQIIKRLSEICRRHDWNLIVKKHPSEFDDLVDGVFKKNKYPNQRLFEHTEMALFDCVYYSDFVCTQNSSAFIEALYLNKPFSYITVNGENQWANLSYFAREKEVGTFGTMYDYEQYLLAKSGDAAYQDLRSDLKKLQEKYLYRTDGRASERLLALARSYIRGKSPL